MQFLIITHHIYTGLPFLSSEFGLVSKDLQFFLLLNESRYRVLMSDSSSVVSLEIILFSITTFSCISFGILYCCKYCWRRMRACSLLSMNTTVTIAQYMKIRKSKNSLGIFQKSADSLLSDEIKIGKRIAKIIKVAMVNLTKNNMVPSCFDEVFCFCCVYDSQSCRC